LAVLEWLAWLVVVEVVLAVLEWLALVLVVEVVLAVVLAVLAWLVFVLVVEVVLAVLAWLAWLALVLEVFLAVLLAAAAFLHRRYRWLVLLLLLHHLRCCFLAGCPVDSVAFVANFCFRFGYVSALQPCSWLMAHSVSEGRKIARFASFSISLFVSCPLSELSEEVFRHLLVGFLYLVGLLSSSIVDFDSFYTCL
jgi:hypothetical protein